MKKLLPWLAAGAGALAYGAAVEANRLKCENRQIDLPRWPSELVGFRIGFFADLHIRDRQTVNLTRQALAWLKGQNPDLLVIGGDLVDRNIPHYRDLLHLALHDLHFFAGKSVAIAGNRDHDRGDVGLVRRIVEFFDCRFLVNEVWSFQGLQLVGIDSANGGSPQPFATLMKTDPAKPMVVLWHEPDMVDVLPVGPELMLSGHSHGGQFGTPWGWTPMKTRNGRNYVRGFYPHAPTPLYVTRGLGTTFFPSRLFCPPEVAVLTLA